MYPNKARMQKGRVPSHGYGKGRDFTPKMKYPRRHNVGMLPTLNYPVSMYQ